MVRSLIDSVSACNGELERSRRVQVVFDFGASKTINIGNGTVRWK